MRCFSCFSLLVLRPIESTVRKCIWCNIWTALYSCLVDLADVALAFEYANSKLVDVVTVADVDDEDRVGNSLLQIWELRFGHKAKLLFRL